MMPRSFILDYNLCSKLHSSDLVEDSPIVEDVLKLSSHQYIDDPLYSALKNLHKSHHYNMMPRSFILDYNLCSKLHSSDLVEDSPIVEDVLKLSSHQYIDDPLYSALKNLHKSHHYNMMPRSFILDYNLCSKLHSSDLVEDSPIVEDVLKLSSHQYIDDPLYSALKNLHKSHHYNMMPRSFILDYNLCSKLHSSDLVEDSPIVEDVLKLSSHQYIDDPLYSALKNLHQFHHYNMMPRSFILDYNLCSKLHSSDLAEDSPIVEDVLKLSSHTSMILFILL